MNALISLFAALLVVGYFFFTLCFSIYLAVPYFDTFDYNFSFLSWLDHIINDYIKDTYKKMTVFGDIIFTIGLLLMIPSFILSLVFIGIHKIIVCIIAFGKATMFKSEKQNKDKEYYSDEY